MCAQYYSNATHTHTHTHKIWYLSLLLAHFLNPLLFSVPFSPSFSSSSQVGIHHHAGGHLSSDSFVNVNYCSLSGVVSARESGTCRTAHCMLRRTQNNQPIGALCLDLPPSRLPSVFLWIPLTPHTLSSPSLRLPLPNMQLPLPTSKSFKDCVVILLLPTKLPCFEDKRWSCFLVIRLSYQINCKLSKHGCVGPWFPPLHEWFGYTFPLWNLVNVVVSPLRNMAYFLLQMSSLGIYLLNCKGRKIIHISVIRHARNTSQNPIRLVIKKRKLRFDIM